MTQQPLAGQVALVTGGGGGIGSAICHRLAAAGAHIVINYHRDRQKAQTLFDALAGDNHLLVQASVTDSTALARMAAQVAERYGRLDLLVNNAGITRPVPHDDLDGLDDALIDQIFQTNWRGAFACVRAFKELLMAGAGGLVVNISSVAAVTGVGSNVAYCASKAAMDSLTRSLARALAPRIRVASVSPGWVWGEYAARMDEAYIQQQIDKTPLGRIAQPEDVADAVLAVAAELRFSTGCIIPVDGGRPLL
ncbi:MAG: SDR family oxidoreductase [Caldilineaceae bacterium]